MNFQQRYTALASPQKGHTSYMVTLARQDVGAHLHALAGMPLLASGSRPTTSA